MTLNDPDPDFKGTLLFDIEYLRNGTRWKHSCVDANVSGRSCAETSNHLERPKGLDRYSSISNNSKMVQGRALYLQRQEGLRLGLADLRVSLILLLLLILLLRTFVERKIRIKYTKCAKSVVKHKCLQSGFANVQRDVR